MKGARVLAAGVGVPAAFIYEHVTRNVNSTDLTVNNAGKYARADHSIYLSRVYKIPHLTRAPGCAAVLGDGRNLRARRIFSARSSGALLSFFLPFLYFFRSLFLFYMAVKISFTVLAARAREQMHPDADASASAWHDISGRARTETNVITSD